jgi:hypothetical protein
MVEGHTRTDRGIRISAWWLGFPLQGYIDSNYRDS